MNRPIVLITGCNGLLGQAVANRLASTYHLIGLDVSEPPDDTAVNETRYTDLTSATSVRQTLDYVREHHGDRIGSVIHLAAYYDFSGEPSPLYDRITVHGTERLLVGLRDGAFDVGQFVFTSTMLVHAPVPPGERIREDSPLDPRWAYPKSKLRTERVIQQEHEDVPYVLLRIAGVYTPYGQQPTLVHQIKRIHQQELASFFFPGDSRAGQSLVHVEDTADAIVRTLERRASLPPEVAILIGEPDPPSYRGLQEAIGELVWGREWPTIRLPEAVAEAGAWLQERTPGADSFIRPFMIELADDHYGLDVSRAERLLGWKPRHELMEELPGIIEKLRRDPPRWYRENGLELPGDLEMAGTAKEAEG
jgi:nucleoside-diphosphate-sugar epimerase